MACLDGKSKLRFRALESICRKSLTKNERRFLRGLADSETPPKPFSSDFTRQYGLRSASNAQRAAESLVAGDVIEREASSYVITDRFLRLWISQLLS